MSERRGASASSRRPGVFRVISIDGVGRERIASVRRATSAQAAIDAWLAEERAVAGRRYRATRVGP